MTRRQLVRDLTTLCCLGGLAAGCSSSPEGALPKDKGGQTAEERAQQEKMINQMKTGYKGAPGIPGGAPGGGPRLPAVPKPSN